MEAQLRQWIAALAALPEDALSPLLRAQTLADDATLEADALDDDTLWLRFSFALASDAVNPRTWRRSYASG